MPVHVIGKREEAKLTAARYQGQRHGISQDKAIAAEEPAAIHLGHAIDDAGQSDYATARQRHLVSILPIQFRRADASMDDEPPAPLCRPIAVLHVFAVVENVMRIGLLDRQRLDPARLYSFY